MATLSWTMTVAGGENRGRAAGMVAVILSNDDVSDRLRRHRLNEFLQNARLGRIVAGVHDHDALRGYDRHRIGVIQLPDKGINVIGEFLKFRLVACHGVGAERRKQQNERDEQPTITHIGHH